MSQQTRIPLDDDRRDFQRLVADGRVLINSSEDPEQVFSAKLMDASADGMNLTGALQGALAIHTGAKLDILVDLNSDDDAPFMLHGTVVWAQPLEDKPDSHCRMGIALSAPNGDNDNQDWRALFMA